MTVKRTILCLLAVFVTAASAASAEGIDLPIRTTPIPETTNSVPHVQLGISPIPSLSAQLLQRVSAIPGVEIRDTVVSQRGAKGFWLNEAVHVARPDVIVGGREFAHVHPDGSLHASLSPELAAQAVAAGWAVPHPWAMQRPGWDGFVMIYTPGSQDELDTVFRLVEESYRFVTGR